MKWVNFLHIYQPPTQTKEVVDQVVRESYTLLVKLLETHPKLHLTMNITGSLVELLEKFGHAGILGSLKKFAEEGRLELVGSAMYHPLMPLISRDEMKRQIMLNDLVLAKYFGAAYARNGFYFPEMAYSATVGQVVKEMDFKWIILDELHAGPIGTVDPRVRYTDAETGLGVIFRHHDFSRTFPPEFVMSNMEKIGDYLVTAHDGELYGHWHQDDKGFYAKAFTSPTIQTMTVSEYFAETSDRTEAKLREASWESLEEELAKGVPFALWKAPGNEVHRKLWDLAHVAEEALTDSWGDENYEAAQTLFDKGLASCAWWWASERKLGPFSPVSWNPTEIYKGAIMLLEAVRSLKTAENHHKVRAEEALKELRDLVWNIHWTKYDPKSEQK